jgi:hypothetical protein
MDACSGVCFDLHTPNSVDWHLVGPSGAELAWPETSSHLGAQHQVLDAGQQPSSANRCGVREPMDMRLRLLENTLHA